MSKPHAHLKTLKKFQIDQTKTVRGVALTKYPPHCVYGQTNKLILIISFNIKTNEEISLPWNYLLIIP